MKLPNFSAPGIFAATTFLLAAPAAQAETAPVYSLDKALTLARKVLAERNEPDVFIRSIALEKPAMFSDKQKWVVTWSRALPASQPRLREIGLSIDMDGRAVRVVK